MTTLPKIFACLLSACIASTLSAQRLPAAYPSHGQTLEQQTADKEACFGWAHNNASVQAVPPTQTDSVGGGQRVAGAGRGAAAGAAIGAITGSAGKGAGVGAVAGVFAGDARARAQQQSNNAQASYVQQQNVASYNQAYSACMKGRGYTIH